MTWCSWLVLGILFGAVGALWRAVYGGKNGAVHCIGCGRCAHSGTCILLEERRKKMP